MLKNNIFLTIFSTNFFQLIDRAYGFTLSLASLPRQLQPPQSQTQSQSGLVIVWASAVCLWCNFGRLRMKNLSSIRLGQHTVGLGYKISGLYGLVLT